MALDGNMKRSGRRANKGATHLVTQPQANYEEEVINLTSV
jgi:hypothetical protein